MILEEIMKYAHKNKTIKTSNIIVRFIGHYITVDAVGLTNGTIGTNSPTNGNIGTNGTIGCRETSGFSGYQWYHWLPMVPLVKFQMVPLGESRTHALSFFIPVTFQ